MNEHEARARAAKVAKLVDGAMFCNDLMVDGSGNWPRSRSVGLRKLADLLDCECSDRMWSLIAVPVNVANTPSARTRAMVTMALRARAEEWDSATDEDAFAGLTHIGF